MKPHVKAIIDTAKIGLFERKVQISHSLIPHMPIKKRKKTMSPITASIEVLLILWHHYSFNDRM